MEQKSTNTFLKSKMNKDLDERLVPNGEYRDAVNIAISKSESANVGAAENVQGTELLERVGKLLEDLIGPEDPLEIIGQLVHEASGEFYLFLTNQNQSDTQVLAVPSYYNPNKQHWVVSYNINANSITLYAGGPFLNFSTYYPINNVNLLETQLFWTDNYNQPRSLDITFGQNIGSFTSYNNLPYNKEDQISVCTYSPYKPINLYKDNGDGDLVTTLQNATDSNLPYVTYVDIPAQAGSPAGADIILETGSSIIPTCINPADWVSGSLTVPEGMQCWTSDGQITPNDHAYITAWDNITKTITISFRDGGTPNVYYGGTTYADGDAKFYVAFLNPNWQEESGETVYPGDQTYLEDRFVRFSYRFKFKNGTYSTVAPYTQSCFIPKQYGYFLEGDEDATYQSTIVSFMENMVNRILLQIMMPEDENGNIVQVNELFNTMDISEIDVLYREAESPVLQVVQTLDQDTLNNYWLQSTPNATVGPTITFTILKETIPVSLNHQRALLRPGGRIFNETAGYIVDIVNVVEDPLTPLVFDVTVNSAQTWTVADVLIITQSVYEFDYQNNDPYKVLPEGQITRVYDKVPVKALTQEIISNRITYANFQDKHTPPESIDYQVNVSSKYEPSSAVGNKSYIAYPNHTVKQNRNYQIGFVLSDRYGRSSSVILSNNPIETTTLGNEVFGADTIYHYYKTLDDYAGQIENFDNVLDWPGDSIKVLVNDVINSVKDFEGSPGLYDGDDNSSDYNPLGWYTYKIVVKQKEQEYYNVYLPYIVNGLPQDFGSDIAIPPAAQVANPDIPVAFTEKNLNEQATIVLINDNINKVPRDLTEVGPEQEQFRSSVRLWGRITPQLPLEAPFAPVLWDYYNGIDPDWSSTEPYLYNQQYYPEITSDVVSTIAAQNDFYRGYVYQASFLPDVSGVGSYEYKTGTEFPSIYNSATNPLVATITTQKAIGASGETDPTLGTPVPEDTWPYTLSVYETAPTESRLDIYWETSTSGLIADLNIAVLEDQIGVVDSIEDFLYDYKEDRDYAYTYTALDSTPYYLQAGGGPTSPQGEIITNDFYFTDALGGNVATVYILDNEDVQWTVVDGNGTNVRWTVDNPDGIFDIIRTPAGDQLANYSASAAPETRAYDTFVVVINKNSVYLQNSDIRTFTFVLPTISQNTAFDWIQIDKSFIISLENVAPKWVSPTGLSTFLFEENCFSAPGSNCVGLPIPPQYKAENGTVLSGGEQDLQLVYGLQSVTQNGQLIFDLFSLQPTAADPLIYEAVKNPNLVASGQYEVVISVVDAGGLGLTTERTETWTFGEPPVNCTFLMQTDIPDQGEIIIPTVNPSLSYPGFIIGSEGGIILWTSKYDPAPANTPVNWDVQWPNGLQTPTFSGNCGASFPVTPPVPWVWLWGNNNDPDCADLTVSQQAALCPPYTPNISTYTCPDCPKDVGLVKSMDMSYGPSWCDSGPSGLTQGTAFIKITLVLKYDLSDVPNPLTPQMSLGANFKAYVQNRKEPVGPPDPWSDTPAAPLGRLQDIEGTYINDEDGILSGQWRISGANPWRIQGGTLWKDNPTGDTDPYPIDYWNLAGATSNTWLAQSQVVPVTAETPFTIQASRTIAVDKNGGYRIALSALKGTLTTLSAAIEGEPGCVKTYTNDENSYAIVEYGDFYYPRGVQQNFWKYEISKEGSATQVAAQNYDIGQPFTGQPAANMDIVYAREPFFRYVTQFYTDPQLTQPWTPTSGASQWFMYKYASTSPANIIPGTNGVPDGNDGSWVGSQLLANGVGSYLTSQRRWIGKFNLNGTKIGRSYPVASLINA